MWSNGLSSLNRDSVVVSELANDSRVNESQRKLVGDDVNHLLSKLQEQEIQILLILQNKGDTRALSVYSKQKQDIISSKGTNLLNRVILNDPGRPRGTGKQKAKPS